jgi:hypothetical protein
MVLTLSLSKKSQKTLVWYYTISTPIPHSLNLKLDYIYPLTSLLRSQAERDSESYQKTTLKIHIFLILSSFSKPIQTPLFLPFFFTNNSTKVPERRSNSEIQV